MTGPPILVGVDGSAPSLAAVDLALREGALRDRAVRIVCGDPWADHPAWANNDTASDLAAATPNCTCGTTPNRKPRHTLLC
jgi:nucleotide-binding universal stress UspA family protein